MNAENNKIVIIGIGYVGLPLAVEFGKKYPGMGFDIRELPSEKCLPSRKVEMRQKN